MSRITLIQPHTHGGVFHREGAALEVDDFSAQWLIQQGVARAAPAQTPKPAVKTPADSASTSTTKE